MLRLNNITKDYLAGDSVVHALRGVTVRFRKNEFVAILGPSGCGKTTLLNIIGGLDRYTEGDLFIAGRSTKEFRDADWDSYRNHSVGFVFQSYNLIPHQSVLSNVELALTLSGVSKGERRRRAKEALARVGLGDQLQKKPNQLSGGQMQRVAIARALVNDPEILLADEPTGALDSETSVQIMEILKEISCDRLVIMVTHNPDLAKQYATRTVGLLDGKLVSDSDPFDPAEYSAVSNEQKGGSEKERKKRSGGGAKKRVSMSFFTALSLSLNNLMTKKGRTFLTSFAGSIGIIGIALILSLSNGINSYIQSVQEDTLASYPISILEEETDVASLLTSITGVRAESGGNHENDAVYSSSVMYELINSMINADKKKNDLKGFKKWLESDEAVQKYIKAVKYSYDVDLHVYAKEAETGEYINADIEKLMTDVSGANSSFTGMYSQFAGITVFEEMLPGNKNEDGSYGKESYVSEMIKEQYELVSGAWPSDKQELLLVLDKNNEITDITQYSLGLVSGKEMQDITLAAMRGTPIEIIDRKWSYEDILGLRLKLALPTDFYKDDDGDGVYEDISEDEVMMNMILSNAMELRISGIVRPKEDATSTVLRGSIGYTSALTEYIIEKTAESEIAKKQTAAENENYDVFTGLPFVISEEEEPTAAEKAAAFREYAAGLDDAGKAALYREVLSTPSEEEINKTAEEYLSRYPDRASREAFIIEQYTAATSYSEEMIREYLAAYSDEELDTALRDGIRQMILTQYAGSAAQTLSAIAATPTAEELAAITSPILEKLQTPQQKIAYLSAAWAERTEIEPTVIMSYVASLSPEELDARVLALVNETAAKQYAAYAGAMQNTAGGLPGVQDAAGAQETGGAQMSEAANKKIAAAWEEYLAARSEEELTRYYDSFMPPRVSDSTLADNLKKLGIADLASPSAISIYAASFEDKDAISTAIEGYNEGASEEEKISYTDYVALLMSSVTKIVDFVSYGLIAFVSISLVVSSIMIGIITYISVLERTKEIGILRSIGASKRNIRTVFNAETLIIGFASGVIGILLTVVLCIPINALMRYLTEINNIAVLPLAGAFILIVISMVLTLIAGLIPASLASKKDPVIALRTE